MNSITAVVLTHNDERTITECLTSLHWCDEIIVVDDYSTDNTLAKVHAAGVNAVIKKRHLEHDFASQRNYGVSLASSEWVVFIDADESVTKELADEVIQKIAQNENEVLDGLVFQRRDYFLGKWLKYGETAHVKLLRCAKKSKGQWTGLVHEIWKIDGKTALCAHPLRHTPHSSVSEFLNDINVYTDILCHQWVTENKHVSAWEIVGYPIGKFLQNYVIRLGFLDGVQGLIVAGMMSFHSYLVRSKTWLDQHPA